jgi:hypothetical protein
MRVDQQEMKLVKTLELPEVPTITLTGFMFNIPVGACFNSHKKSVTVNSVCISLFGDLSYKFRPVMAIIMLL